MEVCPKKSTYSWKANNAADWQIYVTRLRPPRRDQGSNRGCVVHRSDVHPAIGLFVIDEAVQVRAHRTVINQPTHFIIADRRAYLRLWLGVPATVIAAIVAAVTFAQFTEGWVYVIGRRGDSRCDSPGTSNPHKAGRDGARAPRCRKRVRSDQPPMRSCDSTWGRSAHTRSARNAVPRVGPHREGHPVIPDRLYRSALGEVETTGTVGRRMVPCAG
jgi:hypothetical protein